MEVVNEVAKQRSDARDGVAIRADQKSYSYKELISSAWRISSLLCGAELSTVSFFFLVTFLGKTQNCGGNSITWFFW